MSVNSLYFEFIIFIKNTSKNILHMFSCKKRNVLKKELEVDMNVQRINSTNNSTNFGAVRVDVRKPRLPKMKEMKSLTAKIRAASKYDSKVVSKQKAKEYISMINGGNIHLDVLLNKNENNNLDAILLGTSQNTLKKGPESLYQTINNLVMAATDLS